MHPPTKASVLQVSLPTMLKLGVLLASVFAIYRSDLEVIFNEATKSELSSYILVLPFLIAYVLYRKRGALKASTAFDLNNRGAGAEVLGGATLMAFALTLYWNGSFSSYALEYRMLSLPLFIFGGLLTLFGRTTVRVAVFPVLLLFFMTPLPAEVTANLGGTLSLYTTVASLQMIRILGVDATTVTLFDNPAVQFSSLAGGQVTFVISIVCSGLYSLTGFAAFAAFASYIPRGRALAKVSLFLLGFALIYALNILRVIIILLVGRWYGEGAALQVFHTFGGSILIFFGTLGLLYIGERVWRLRFRNPSFAPQHRPHDTVHVDLLGGFCSLCGALVRFPKKSLSKLESAGLTIIVLMTILMVLAQIPLIAYAQGPNANIFSIPPGNTAPPDLLPKVNTTFGTWNPQFLFRDQAFEQVTSPYMDAAWLYTFYPEDLSSRLPSISLGIQVAQVNTYLDPPEISLVYVRRNAPSPPTIVALEHDLVLLESPFIAGNLLIYKDGINNAINNVIYYWYEQGTFRKGNAYYNEIIKSSLVTTANALQAAGLVTDITNLAQIEQVLRPFAQAVASYWEPVKSASTLAQYLSSTRRTVLPLLTATILAGVILSGYMELDAARRRKEAHRIKGRLQTPEDRALMSTATQPAGITLDDAQRAMTSRGYAVSADELLGKLTAAEKLGLIRRRLTLEQDRAAQRWQPQRSLQGILNQIRKWVSSRGSSLRL